MAIVTANDAFIFPGIFGGVFPRGGVGIDEQGLAGNAGVAAVGAIEGDAPPIDELARVSGGDTHGVFVIEHPGIAFGNSALALIEADVDSLLSDVHAAAVASTIDLEGPIEDRAEVHEFKRLALLDHAWTLFNFGEVEAFGEAGEVGLGGFEVLALVERLQEGFADVVDGGILLFRIELDLGDHHAVSLLERLIHPVGVAAVLEGRLVELQGGGQAAFLVLVAVAGDAEGVVDDFSFREGLLVPASDEIGVISNFQRLDPGVLALETFVGLQGELNRSAGLSEAIEGFAVLAGGPVEIGSVDCVDVTLDQGGEFRALQ